MGVVNKDQFLQAVKSVSTIKEIDGIGSVAFVPLSRAKTWEFSKKKEGKDAFNDLEFACWLIAAMVVDGDGEPIISTESAFELSSADGKKFDDLFNAAFLVSGLSSEEGTEGKPAPAE